MISIRHVNPEETNVFKLELPYPLKVIGDTLNAGWKFGLLNCPSLPNTSKGIKLGCC